MTKGAVCGIIEIVGYINAQCTMHNAQLWYRPVGRYYAHSGKAACGGFTGGLCTATASAVRPPSPLRSCGLLFQNCLLIAN